MEWIKIKTRPLTEEEKESSWAKYWDLDYVYDCKLPEAEEDVLITTAWGSVTITTFCDDCDGVYFDSFDIEDVIAWMPLPEPANYKE